MNLTSVACTRRIWPGHLKRDLLTIVNPPAADETSTQLILPPEHLRVPATMSRARYDDSESRGEEMLYYFKFSLS